MTRRKPIIRKRILEDALLEEAVETRVDSFSIIAAGILNDKSDAEIKNDLYALYPNSTETVFQKLIDETRRILR